VRKRERKRGREREREGERERDKLAGRRSNNEKPPKIILKSD
jgi:hypothetical protein